MNPDMFLLHIAVFLLHASGRYCGGLEFKYPGTIAKNESSIMLEKYPTPEIANVSPGVLLSCRV